MTNQNKFAAALKTTRKSAPLSTPPTPGRKARRHIGGYFDDEVAQQLRFLAVASSTAKGTAKNAPLSRRFSKKRLMDCSRHAERSPESVARDGTQAEAIRVVFP